MEFKEFKPGDDPREFTLAAYREVVEALRARRKPPVAPPLRWAGDALDLAIEEGFWATLHGPGNPYAMSEVVGKSGGLFEDFVRSCEDCAYEVNDQPGLDGKVIWLMPGAAGEYVGQWIATGGASGFWQLQVVYCGNGVAGAVPTVRLPDGTVVPPDHYTAGGVPLYPPVPPGTTVTVVVPDGYVDPGTVSVPPTGLGSGGFFAVGLSVSVERGQCCGVVGPTIELTSTDPDCSCQAFPDATLSWSATCPHSVFPFNNPPGPKGWYSPIFDRSCPRPTDSYGNHCPDSTYEDFEHAFYYLLTCIGRLYVLRRIEVDGSNAGFGDGFDSRVAIFQHPPSRATPGNGWLTGGGCDDVVLYQCFGGPAADCTCLGAPFYLYLTFPE
jgi:hypothetical protein